MTVLTMFARGGYSSTRSYSSSRSYGGYSSSRSYSSGRSSYSSTRSSSSSGSRPYNSTRSSGMSSRSYTSTRTSTKATSYRSTRTYTPITRSNLYHTTTPMQRTTVVHNYYNDHYWYNGFFHPFGWGYGGGDFWFWMWLFDRPQYAQQQQVLQAQPTGMVQQSGGNAWLGDIFLIVLLISMGVGFWALIRWLRRHFMYVG